MVKVLSVLSMRECRLSPGQELGHYILVVQPPKLIKIHSHKCPSRMIVKEWGP